MDLQRRTALLDLLRPFGLTEATPASGLALPLVTLDDFFLGNDDARSIGPQIGAAHPGVAAIHAELQAIAARDDVDAVLVQARDAQYAYDSDDEWVASNCAIVITAADAASVSEWAQRLHCAAVAKGFPQPPPPNAPVLREGHSAWQLVWT